MFSCVCPLPHSLSSCTFFLASSGNVYRGPIHLLPPRSLSLLPICFSPHPFLNLVAFPCISRPSVALQIHLSVAQLFFFSLLWFSYLREAEAPLLFQLMFLSFFLPLFSLSFLVSFTPPPPPFFLSLSLLGALLSKVIVHLLKIISSSF